MKIFDTSYEHRDTVRRARHGMPWTEGELQKLRGLFHSGLTLEGMCIALERPAAGVIAKLASMNLMSTPVLDLRARFEQLPQHAKDTILGEHRYRDVSNVDWWEFLFDQFKEDMLEKGIEVNQIYFSGFSSQGDGACFKGYIQNIELFFRAHELDKKYPLLLEAHKADFDDAIVELGAGVSARGLYCHDNTMYIISEDIEVRNYVDKDENPLRYAAIEIYVDEFNSQAQEFSAHCLEIFRAHARTLYRQLNDEHDYLTSDEHVLEFLISNEMLEQEIERFE